MAIAKSRYTGIAISPITPATIVARVSTRSVVPGTRRMTARAISSRSMSRPIALMMLANITHRAIRSCAVTAVALTRGTGNWGAGPGFGPTANVNAPWTGWPSTEIARQ